MPQVPDEPELVLGPFGPVNSVCFDSSGARLAAGCHDDQARIWDCATGAELCRIPHPGNVFQAVLSPDGALLATGCRDGRLRVLDAARGTVLAATPASDEPVITVAINPDGTQVGYGTRGGILRVIEARTGAQLGAADRRAEISRVEFSGSGERVVASCYDGTAIVLTVGADPGFVEISGIAVDPRAWGPGPAVRCATFSPDGERVAFGGHDTDRHRGRAHVATVAGQITAELPHDDYVSSVAFCLAGDALATASGTRVQAFDIRSQSRRWQRGHDGLVWEVASSPAGTVLATACHDGTARLFDAATGQELAVFRHDGPVTTLAFGPDGRAIATGSWDGYARVFRVP
jgi:WD40 repeat protein